MYIFTPDAFEAACRHAGSNCSHSDAISILRCRRVLGSSGLLGSSLTTA